LQKFVQDRPKKVPISVEITNEEWFADEEIFDKIMNLSANHSITNINLISPK
jgi:hypothetical protein